MIVATVCYPVNRPKSFEMFKGTVMQIEKALINAFQLFIIMQEFTLEIRHFFKKKLTL